MNRWFGLVGLAAFGVGILLAAHGSPAAADEEHGGREIKVSIDAVPAGVKAAIVKEVGSDRLVDIGEITLKDGRKVYEIEMWKDGCEYDVLFDSDGKVLAREKETDEDDEDGDDETGAAPRQPKIEKASIDEVPAKVKATVLKEAGENEYRLGRVGLPNGKTIYVAAIRTRGLVQISANGNVLMRHEDDGEEGENEVKVSIDDVPAKVKAAILMEVGSNRLVDIGEITLKDGRKVYEIEMWKDGCEYDVLFDSDGKVLAREKDQEEDGGDDD
jgi:uncharacterized membrane protein YkoI